MVSTRTGPVIVNGSEGESASGKDTVLLTHVPHLVLDAAVMTARALDTRSVVVRIPAARSAVIDVVRAAIDERDDRGIRVSVSPGEDTFIAGEASAVISSLQGGAAGARHARQTPTMRSGLRSRPVLLSNVETFARLAVAVRGHWDSSSLLTVSGAVTESGVRRWLRPQPWDTSFNARARPRSRRPDHRRLARHMASRNPTTLSTPANRDALGGIGGPLGRRSADRHSEGSVPVESCTPSPAIWWAKVPGNAHPASWPRRRSAGPTDRCTGLRTGFGSGPRSSDGIDRSDAVLDRPYWPKNWPNMQPPVWSARTGVLTWHDSDRPGAAAAATVSARRRWKA